MPYKGKGVIFNCTLEGLEYKVEAFAFGAGTRIAYCLAFELELPDELETVLIRWTGGFRDDDFAEDASGKDVLAYFVSPEKAFEHIDLLESRLKKVTDDIASLEELG